MNSEAIWRRKTDEEVAATGAVLAEYSEHGEAVIRAEMRRRGIPEPPPSARESPHVANPFGRLDPTIPVRPDGADDARRVVADPSWLEYLLTAVGVVIMIAVASRGRLSPVGWIAALIGGGYGWWSGVRILLPHLRPAWYTWRCSVCTAMVEPKTRTCPHCGRRFRM